MQHKVEEVFLNLVSHQNVKIPVVTNASCTEEDGKIINVCVFIPVHNRRKFEDELIAAKLLAEKSLKENHLLIQTTKELDSRARELERNNKTLHNLNDEVLQISSIIDHELRECTRKIVLFSKLSKQDTSEDYLKKIITTANRLKQISNSLNDILNLSDVKEGFHTYPLQEIIEKAKSKLPDGKILNIKYESLPLPNIEILAAQIEMLFYQLFCNSIKYRTSDEVNVKLAFVIYEKNLFKHNTKKYHYSEVIKLTICDDSEGFDPEYKNYVFQILKTMGNPKDGIGAGLALCKKIIDNHHGEISIDSKAGAGTVIKIILPLSQK